MMLEFAAARVVAPWFGTSIFVWGNIIGAVLIALSIGYYKGGRLADRHPDVKYLTAIVYGAGLFTVLIPVWIYVFTRQLSVAEVVAGGGLLSTIVGSFIMIVLLFAFPVGLLGMVSPFVIRLATERVQSAGSVAGALYAWSTIGSIIGTFASAFFFVPFLGSRETILLSAASLLGIAVLGYRRNWWLMAGVGLPALMYVVFSTQPLRADAASLYETESQYQYIQVQDEGDRLALSFNEGLGTQSYYMKQGVLTESYYDYLALLPAAVPQPTENQPQAVVIGLAGGTITRQLAHYFPEWQLTGVELDPAVIAIAQRYFQLQEQPTEIIINDGRMFLQHTEQRYDLIFIDAYANEYYIPWHLTTQEFYQTVAEHLTPDGAVAFNIGSTSEDTQLFRAFVATLKTSFAHVYVAAVPDSLNFVVVASQQSLDTSKIKMTDEREEAARALRQNWHEVDAVPEATVLTDNRAPIELYTENMIWQYLWDIVQ